MPRPRIVPRRRLHRWPPRQPRRAGLRPANDDGEAMALGFTLNQVVEMATVNAAKLLGRNDDLGLIRVGSPADISVLRLEEREWNAVDSQKGTIIARRALMPVYAIRGDTIHERLATGRL